MRLPVLFERCVRKYGDDRDDDQPEHEGWATQRVASDTVASNRENVKKRKYTNVISRDQRSGIREEREENRDHRWR